VEFERVRAEWLDGLKSERQEPQRLATLTAVRALFGPVLGAPVDGRLSDVSKLTVADVRDFHRSAYTPDRAALIVVGDIDPQKLDPQVTPLFGRWQGKSTLPAPAAAAPSVPEKTKVLIVDRLSAVQSAVVAIQPFPNRSAPGHEAREILGRVLGGLFTSRLNMNLREKHGYTYGAFAQPVESRVWGALVVSTSVRTDATADSLHEIELELRRMRNPSLGAPLTPDELHRAKADLVYKLGETLEHPSTIAETSSEIFVEGLPLDYDSRYPSLVAGISADAVNSAARDIAPERLLFVIVGDRSQIEPELVRRGYSVELAPAAFTE
jgi:zinc protease